MAEGQSEKLSAHVRSPLLSVTETIVATQQRIRTARYRFVTLMFGVCPIPEKECICRWLARYITCGRASSGSVKPCARCAVGLADATHPTCGTFGKAYGV